MLIGAHESVAGGVSLAFERAASHRGRSLQIFTRSARGWTAPPLADDERRRFRAEARRTGLPAIAHGNYLVNLGSEDPVIRPRSIACVIDEYTRCERLGIRYLVIHPGVHAELETGLRLISQGLDEIHRATPRFRSRILLEVTAGQGNCIGWRFEHLAELLSRTSRGDRLGICLDTCHLFAAGYDLSTPRGYEQVMDEFDRLVGLQRVQAIHLNDSKKGLGCRVDRHEEVGEGMIGLGAFRCLVNDQRFKDTIGVLETPTPERYSAAIARLESLAGT